MLHEKSKKNTDIAQRRERAVELHLTGHRQREIAKQLNCDISTVCRDIAAIREEWKKSAIEDYDEKIALECQRIDAIEREAWDGWRRSQKPEVTTEERSGCAGSERSTSTKTRNQAGAPAFLSTAIACVKARCQLLGLDRADPNLGGNTGVPMTIIFSSAPDVPTPSGAESHQAAIEDQSDQSEKIG